MAIQSEAILEQKFIEKLQSLNYQNIKVKNEPELIHNLKIQLENHNKTLFSDNEFKKILLYLKKGSVFEKAAKLRAPFILQRDDESSFYISFLDTKNWCQNIFQVTSQIEMTGNRHNRYDVTILINGLPLVQVELKRKGINLKEAFNQINRYTADSYSAGAGLFKYIQLFIISNEVETKYFANNKEQSFKQTFFWTDEYNKKISDLNSFAEAFLDTCFLSKFISRYMILSHSKNTILAMRPYQYYATEKTLEYVKNSNNNAYIWHTTGSGKTLTSFKISQLIAQTPEIDKVIFVVDRSDLNDQTTAEFEAFSESEDLSTSSTNKLIKKLLSQKKEDKLIVTTIQKINAMLNKNLNNITNISNQKIVFLFDECHRSQFGDTQIKIQKVFNSPQMIGFTGTPIFEENSNQSIGGVKRTTASIFNKCLHTYIIDDAISDGNVLPFFVEYYGKYNYKNEVQDIQVSSINTDEVLHSIDRMTKIVNHIKTHHVNKTSNNKYTSIFAADRVEQLWTYYNLLKKIAPELKIAAIFSFSANEDSYNGGNMGHSRDYLDKIIYDYNKRMGTSFSLDGNSNDGFSNYRKNILKSMRETGPNKNIDILLVVDMFLTGFDSPAMNTLYVDKNLKYHGLIQSFSRTNRILDESKPYGNIVCFRNLKNEVDEAVRLFSNKDNTNSIIIDTSYKELLDICNIAIFDLLNIAPFPSDVDNLLGETQKKEFVLAFRRVISKLNQLRFYTEFNFSDLSIGEEVFFDYKSKYLTIYDEFNNLGGDKVSILDDIDFEIELIRNDLINVDYIFNMADSAKLMKGNQRDKKVQDIKDMLGREPSLHSKSELINEFLESQDFYRDGSTKDNFEDYKYEIREKKFNELCARYDLEHDEMKKYIEKRESDGIVMGLKPKHFLNPLPIKQQIKRKKNAEDDINNYFNMFF